MNEIKMIFSSFIESIPLYKKIKFKGKKTIPIIIILLLALLHFFIGDKISDFLIIFLKEHIKIGTFTEKAIQYISKLGTIIIYFYSYKFLVLSIFSPFLSKYSETIEDFYQNKNYNFGFIQNLKFMFRGIGISIVCLIIETSFTGTFFFLGIFIPFKFIFYFLTLLIQNFFVAYSFADYFFERREYGIKESLKEAFKNFLPLSFIGILFTLFLLIPVIGIIYGPVYFTGVTTLYLLKKNRMYNKS